MLILFRDHCPANNRVTSAIVSAKLKVSTSKKIIVKKDCPKNWCKLWWWFESQAMMTFGGSAGICCRNQKLIATIPPETRSVPTFFIITLSRIFVKLLHDLHHKWPHHSKTACCSPKDLDPLSLYAASLRKNKELRERKEKQLLLISLNSVKYCFSIPLNSDQELWKDKWRITCETN